VQNTEIAARISPENRQIDRKRPEFPVIFPVLSSPPGLPDLQGMKVGNNAPLNGI
jgi:hypothetical protein